MNVLFILIFTKWLSISYLSVVFVSRFSSKRHKCFVIYVRLVLYKVKNILLLKVDWQEVRNMSDFEDLIKGIEDFKEIIQDKSAYYVDKTSHINRIFKNKVALFTRPRRFGKTLTMSMLKYFFEMNYDNPNDISSIQELFTDLDILKDTEFCKQHMGQYPVIFLSLKDIDGNNFEEAMIVFVKNYMAYGKVSNQLS